MELRHLRYFVAVADELNFTRAGQKLNLTQPSLTRQIQDLEGELGVSLLDRTRSRVVLTDEGASFLIDARRILELSRDSMKSVRSISGSESGPLNVGYLFKFNFDLLPVTLRDLYAAFPKVTVNLFDMTPAEQLRALQDQKIDLAFVGLRPPFADATRDVLTWECVAEHEIVVVLPENHALTRKAKIQIGDLRSLYFVAMSEETHPGSRDWLSGICQTADFKPRILQDVVLESGIMTFVAEGLGVTLAREPIHKLPHPGVVFRPLSRVEKAQYWIAWRSENRSQSLRQFVEIIRKVAPIQH